MNSRALVVDDDQVLAKTLADVLRLKGWVVTTVNSGADAVNAAAATEFDIVLMDFKMPGMDGVSTFKALKRLRPKPNVVLMSAYLAQEVVDEAQREGILRVLSKPVDVGVLLEFLADVIKRPFRSSAPVPKPVQ
jgi:CheY-like chemotaxis protein